MTKEEKIVPILPYTNTSNDWMIENIDDEAQYWGGSLAVDHRCASAILEAAQADGLSIGYSCP